MSDGLIDPQSAQYKAYQATLPKDLESQIMDCRIPKNEREWWASKEIASLRAQLVSCEGQWRKEVDANKVVLDQLAEAREKLAAAREALKEGRRLAYEIEGGNRWPVEWDDDTRIEPPLLDFKNALERVGLGLPAWKRDFLLCRIFVPVDFQLSCDLS